MHLLLTDAGSVTLRQALTSVWNGFKDLPVTIGHLISDHTSASLLHLCHLIGVLIFFIIVIIIVRIVFSRRVVYRRRVHTI